jgi:hypothetical protein
MTLKLPVRTTHAVLKAPLSPFDAPHPFNFSSPLLLLSVIRLQVNMVHLNVPNVSSTSQKWTTTTSEANKLLEIENAAKLVGVSGMVLCCTSVQCAVLFCSVLYWSVVCCTPVQHTAASKCAALFYVLPLRDVTKSTIFCRAM